MQQAVARFFALSMLIFVAWQPPQLSNPFLETGVTFLRRADVEVLTALPPSVRRTSPLGLRRPRRHHVGLLVHEQNLVSEHVEHPTNEVVVPLLPVPWR